MTAALEVRRWNTIWALREVLSGGSLWGRYIQKRTLKKEEKKSLKKRWKIVKSFVFWIGVGKKNWRWRFRDVGSDGQVPSSDRRLLQNWVLGRHSKEANENKVEKIEYDINNIMFKWPQRPSYLKLSFSDSKFLEVILRRQIQFLSTETAWITLGGQKTKKKLKCPNSQVTQSFSLSS